jgi:hypothetical protein
MVPAVPGSRSSCVTPGLLLLSAYLLPANLMGETQVLRIWGCRSLRWVKLLTSLDGARYDSLREMQPGAREVPEVAPAPELRARCQSGRLRAVPQATRTATNKRCQTCRDHHAEAAQIVSAKRHLGWC